MTPKPAIEVPDPGAISRREARMRADTAVEIVLLRHGEPDWTPGGGPSVLDATLTARGRLQAETAAAALAGRAFDAIYTSPLRRAQETAEPLAKATGLSPITLDSLAEISIPLVGVAQPEVDAFFREATMRRRCGGTLHTVNSSSTSGVIAWRPSRSAKALFTRAWKSRKRSPPGQPSQ